MRGVIFDMDGVLVFTEHAHYIAFKVVAHQHLGLDLNESEYRAHFAGRTDKSGWQEFCSAKGKPFELATLIKAGEDGYIEIFEQEVQPNLDMIRVLEQVKHSGISIGLASSSTRREVDITVRRFGLAKLIQTCISADDVISGKPSPELYLLAAHHLGTAPSHIVVVEDSPPGIASAHAAGMRCIAVTTTHSTLDLSLADLVVAQLTARDVFSELDAADAACVASLDELES